VVSWSGALSSASFGSLTELTVSDHRHFPTSLLLHQSATEAIYRRSESSESPPKQLSLVTSGWVPMPKICPSAAVAI